MTDPKAPDRGAQPGGRAPAPGGLAIVQAFVNSVDIEEGRDELDTLDGFRRWIADAQLDELPPGFTDEDRAIAVRLRESIRDFAGTCSAPSPSDVAQTEFAESVDLLALRVEVAGGGVRFTSATAVGRALGPLVDAIRCAMDDGTWRRLKACERQECRWLFYDHSRNQASHWCASSICGSREKSRRAYARKVGTRTGRGEPVANGPEGGSRG